MKLTNPQEEYLKTIYILEQSSGKIRVTDIAKKLKITKPSVNRAIKNLRDLDLVEYEVYGDIKLTYQGEEKAKEILLQREITIAVTLGDGSAEAQAYGCDLTYDYVKINGDYRT